MDPHSMTSMDAQPPTVQPSKVCRGGQGPGTKALGHISTADPHHGSRVAPQGPPPPPPSICAAPSPPPAPPKPAAKLPCRNSACTLRDSVRVYSTSASRLSHTFVASNPAKGGCS